MSKEEYSDLGSLLEEVQTGTISNGTILTNEDTGERVVIQEGSFHFLTKGDYVSHEVPLTRGMILAKWSIEKPDYQLIDIVEAIDKVSKGATVMLNGIDVSTTRELLQELTIHQAVSLSKLNGLTYAVDAEQVSPNKFARKTTETDAWAILMDANLMDYPAERISDKYGISVRSVYYILDGTHYTSVHTRFFQLLESGELYFEHN